MAGMSGSGEEKFVEEKFNERLPDNWLGYFDEPYPDWIERQRQNQTDRERLDSVFNGIADHLKSLRSNPKMARLREEYIVLRPILEQRDGELNYSLGTDILNGYAKNLLCIYFPETRNEFRNERHPSETLETEFDYIKRTLSNLGEGEVSCGMPSTVYSCARWYQSVEWSPSEAAHPRQYYTFLKNIERYAKDIDVVIGAPRSAVFSEQVLKGAVDYLQEREPETFTDTYFGFPKSKAFKALGHSGAYMIPADRFEYAEDFLRRAKNGRIEQFSDKVERVLFEDVNNLANTIVKKYQEKGRKINVFGYDEAVNLGRTRGQLGRFISLAISLAEHKLGEEDIAVKKVLPGIDPKGRYGSWPKYMRDVDPNDPDNEGRYSREKFQRYSPKDDPEKHSIASFSFLVGYLTGQHIGFLYDTVKKIEDLSSRKENSTED